jgi:1L-myo-inositol 1-phosphate cytidylyltransferase
VTPLLSKAPVPKALVLAAGNGDRFINGSRESKLLQPVLGEPLILRTLRTAVDAGITHFEVVLGYRADTLRTLLTARRPFGATINFSFNPDWRLENGVSVLAARTRLADGPFALLMGDHLFEPAALARLLHEPLAPMESALAIDTRPAPADVTAEATKVRTQGSRVVAIGKTLAEFDALDTGMFVCSPTLFDALERSRAQGDTTLSGGVRILASERLVLGVPVGDADWYDIDTMADLKAAESRLHAQPQHA